MFRSRVWLSPLFAFLVALAVPLVVPPALSQDDTAEEEDEEETAAPTVGGLDFKNPEKVRQEYEKRVATSPDVPLNHYNLAFAYQKLKKYPEAAASFRRFVELKPDDPKGYYFLGYNQIKAGAAKDAVPTLEKGIQAAETAGDAEVEGACRALLGDSYVKSGQYDKAITMYNNLLQSGGDVDKMSIYNNLGRIYVKKGDMEKAIDYFKKSAGADPNNPTSQFNLAVMFYQMAQKADPAKRPALYKSAHEGFEKVLSLNPRDTEALYLSGETGLLVGDPEEAKQRLRKYLEVAPTGSWAEDARELLADAK